MHTVRIHIDLEAPNDITAHQLATITNGIHCVLSLSGFVWTTLTHVYGTDAINDETCPLVTACRCSDEWTPQIQIHDDHLLQMEDPSPLPF